MKIYCWEVSLIVEYLVFFVKTTVNVRHLGGQIYWLLGILKFALHPKRLFCILHISICLSVAITEGISQVLVAGLE